ncbi:MAG TPA: histone deacetylase [Promineifilum sp.]
MTTLLIYAPAEGHTKNHHPESHLRMRDVLPALERYGLLADLLVREPVPASAEQLRTVHSSELIEFIRRKSSLGNGLLDQGDTYVTAQSYEAARLAAGSCALAVDLVMTGVAQNGFALVRPPGHHAEADHVSGFCLFNNVAVAARRAQLAHDIKRVAIVDFDIHHGNGTQNIFYEDSSVLFVSAHLYAPYFYPGTGSAGETGTGQGRGYTMNIPLPPLVGDLGYRQMFRKLIEPRLDDFQPELLLVSAGFDAHWSDPLAMGGLSLRGLSEFAQRLVRYADAHCEGRVVFVLEGGYQTEVLSSGIANVFHALLSQDVVHDPVGQMPQAEQDISGLLTRLGGLHLSNQAKQ